MDQESYESQRATTVSDVLGLSRDKTVSDVLGSDNYHFHFHCRQAGARRKGLSRRVKNGSNEL